VIRRSDGIGSTAARYRSSGVRGTLDGAVGSGLPRCDGMQERAPEPTGSTAVPRRHGRAPGGPARRSGGAVATASRDLLREPSELRLLDEE